MKTLYLIRHAKSDWNSIGKNSTQFVSFDYPKKHIEPKIS